jgi:hypothetical protein
MNLFGDPDFNIWARKDGSPPTWWNRSATTLNVARATSVIGATSQAEKSHSGKFLTKLSHGGATGRFYQNVLSTGDAVFSDNKHLLFTDAGQSASMGAWIYTNSNDCKLYINLGTCAVLSSACATNVWTWKTITATITSDAVSLGGGVQLDAAGSAYVACPTLVLGPIPPKNFIPCPVSRGTIGTQLSGSPPPQSTSILGGSDGKFRYSHNLPWMVTDVDAEALSAASTSNGWTFSLLNWGSSVREMFTTSNRPSIPAATWRFSGATFKSDSTALHTRCFEPRMTSTFKYNLLELIVASSVVGAGCKNPTITIRTLTYQPPLLSWRTSRNYK